MLFKDIKIEYVPIDDLIDFEQNARKVTEKDFNDLKANMSTFGFIDPIIANSYEPRKNIIIGGHFRRKVAKALGFGVVPVIYLNLSSFELEKEISIRLNKNTGSFDFDILANYYDEDKLKEWGFSEYELGLNFHDKEEKESKGSNGLKTLTFTLSPEQADRINEILEGIQETVEYETIDTYGNTSKKGNALYTLCTNYASL